MARDPATLVAALAPSSALLAATAAVDHLRGRTALRLALRLDARLRAPIFDAIRAQRLARARQGDGRQPARDLDLSRGFLSDSGPAAFADVPSAIGRVHGSRGEA